MDYGFTVTYVFETTVKANSKEEALEQLKALIDSGADLNNPNKIIIE